MEALQERDFGSKEYKRSRKAYAMECTFEYFVSLLVTEAFLAKVLTSIGMSDALIGVVSTLIALSYLFQFFSVFVVQKICNTKRFVIIFHSLGQLFFMALYFVPFLPFVTEYKTVIAVACILLAYFGNYFVTNIIYNWGNSYVSPSWRGLFGAKKETLSLVSGVVVTLAVGYVMDYFEAMDNLEGGFVFSAIAILIFCISDFICLLLIKNDIKPRQEAKAAEPTRVVMKKLFGNKGFLNLLVLTVLWNCAQYTTVGFLGTYRIKELGYTVGAVAAINVLGHLSRAALSRPFGIYSDKHSFAKGIRLALVVSAVGFAVNVFTTPSTRFLIIVYTVLHCVGQAGIGANMLNITYSYVPREYYVQATAIRNSIGGICGFTASILASRLLQGIQDNGNMIFGMPFYGQQVLSMISLSLVVITILFTHFVIGRQKVMLQ